MTPTTVAFEVVVRIYNDAGELVRTLEGLGAPGPVRSLKLSADYFSPDGDGVEDSVEITFDESASPARWDGRDDNGIFVSNGSYTVVVESNDGDGRRTVVSRTVAVFRAGTALLEGVAVWPNPARQRLVVEYDLPAGVSLKARVYTLAAEMVTKLEGQGRGQLVWQLAEEGAADGLYLVLLEAEYDGIKEQRAERVMVIK